MLKFSSVCSIVGKDTAHMDAQNVVTSIEQLFSLNGWVAALCPTLTRPFGQNKHEHAYDDIISKNHLYYIGIVIHSADHFLVDQLAVIVQLAKRLGPSNLFVSMLDYDSTDSTATLTDLSEAVLTLLGVPFRIRKVPGMTEDPNTAYYPLEEAHMRNLALEPLKELYQKRNIKFHRVIWLKGFTCPNDIFETLKISEANEAAMVCGMDWAEHNGFFIFSDRCVVACFTVRALCRKLTIWRIGGERATSTETSSDSLNHPQNQMRSRQGTRLAPNDTHSIFPSRCSVASRGRTSSTLLSRITRGYFIVRVQISTTFPAYHRSTTERLTPHAWTAAKLGSAGICGRIRPTRA